MSIEMENPKSLLEKIDAAANLVKRMSEAHTVMDQDRLRQCYAETTKLLADATKQAEQAERVRAALVKLVGADTPAELEGMAKSLITLAPDGKLRALTLNAIKILIETNLEA